MSRLREILPRRVDVRLMAIVLALRALGEGGSDVAVPASGQPAPLGGDAGRMTQYQYDSNNRLAREISALNITTAYTYDARGNRSSRP